MCYRSGGRRTATRAERLLVLGGLLGSSLRGVQERDDQYV